MTENVPLAFTSIRFLLSYVEAKKLEGLLTYGEADAIFDIYNTLIHKNAGIAILSPAESSHLGVARHAAHAMKRKLLSLHPEFEEELIQREQRLSR